FCVASVLGSSCTTCTLRSCAPYAPINSSKYLCFERSLINFLVPNKFLGFPIAAAPVFRSYFSEMVV
ncbi:MAG: hypothetical protein LBJ16_00100, partial [Holosporaceae bacterium]|nr:hypothetical protein [Holosporaceae bacterium]